MPSPAPRPSAACCARLPRCGRPLPASPTRTRSRCSTRPCSTRSSSSRTRGLTSSPTASCAGRTGPTRLTTSTASTRSPATPAASTGAVARPPRPPRPARPPQAARPPAAAPTERPTTPWPGASPVPGGLATGPHSTPSSRRTRAPGRSSPCRPPATTVGTGPTACRRPSTAAARSTSRRSGTRCARSSTGWSGLAATTSSSTRPTTDRCAIPTIGRGWRRRARMSTRRSPSTPRSTARCWPALRA
jgi:hypothetical protein